MLIRWNWVAVVAGICIFGLPRHIAEPDWLTMDGRAWDRLSPESRRAYLAGFLAGSGTSEALAAGVRDSAGLMQTLDSLTRAGFRFPYSSSVYEARVADFYWYEDRRPLPIWFVLWEVNNRLREPPDGRH
jgi:hypothetical protein